MLVNNRLALNYEQHTSCFPPLLFATLLLAILTSLAGCAATQETISTYVLDATPPPKPASLSTAKVLLVNTPQTQPGFDSQGIAYTLTPLAVDYYTKSQWADTPALMFAPLVVHTLESTGAFRAVLTPPTPVLDDLRLDIDIIRLQQEFYETPSKVRFTLRAKLFDVPSGHVLATQLFEVMEPAPSEDAYGGVLAANAAAQRMLGEIRDFVLAYALAD